MSDEYEDRIAEAEGVIWKAVCASCCNADGKIDVLMASLAMGQIIGSNASLLPSSVAGEVLQRTGARVRETYIAGLSAGGSVQ
jgi:hypothetical protein